MNTIVTVILPVHNAERTLRVSVLRLLDVAETLSRRIQVAVVDDGSTDGTFEAASELAREFPQVRVLRQPYQLGLGGALEQVRTRLGVTQVVVHDGIASIDADELAEVLQHSSSDPASFALASTDMTGRGSRRIAAIASRGDRSREFFRSAASFRWLRLDEPTAPRRKRNAEYSAPYPGISLANVCEKAFIAPHATSV